MAGGGGGGSLDATNPITPGEASADLSGALGQAQTGGVWAQPGVQAPGAYGLAPQVDAVYNPQAGVQTGIPQGGFAAPGIAQYFRGGGEQAAISYDAGAHDPWLGEVAQDAQDTADTYVEMSTPDDPGGNVSQDPVSGELVTDEGTPITYDNQFEYGLGENIVDIINEGGVNPETGDEWISAGPNVLSAADEGLFGFGADYNQEFGENYDAQFDHAQANPTGQSTGTPLYDQGYVGLGVDPLADAVGGIVNNSTLGTIGTAITGEPLMADLTSLLPPDESFSNYGGSDDNDSSPPPGFIGDNTSGTNTFAQDWANTFTPDDGTSYVGGVLTYDSDTGGGGGGGDDGGDDDDAGGCVIGTYALAQGLDLNRDGAVRWCTATLHDHWIGETIRMGYQHWGRKQIANGYGEKRFTEFQNFANYVSGYDTSLIAGLKVYARMTQCFMIGLTRRVTHATTL